MRTRPSVRVTVNHARIVAPVQAETALTAALSAYRSETVAETSAYSVMPHRGFTRRDMRLKAKIVIRSSL